MPELPEVETVRRGLEQQTAGFQITKVLVHRERAIASPADPKAFCNALKGCQVGQWSRRGKYLHAQLQRDNSPAGHWGVHLRMTGQFLWIDAQIQGDLPLPACRHTRVQLWNQKGQELRFIDMRSFGQMWWVPPDQAIPAVITGLQKLGPEPFSEGFTACYLRQKLKGSSRPIKNALLDQALVAGVGNIYADEALFSAGIRPQTPSRALQLPQLQALRDALVKVLELSIGAGGTTFSDFRDLTGTNGNYGGMALVYRRGGQPCRHCGTAIQREKLGGRSSHWCPICQH